MSCRRQLVSAACIVDGSHVHASPGALLLEGREIVAAGPPEAIGEVPDVEHVDLSGTVVMPALVNAHAHLDLTHLDGITFEGDFIRWIEQVRSARATEDDAIAGSVRAGIERALAGGTALLGDIAGVGSTVPVEVLRASPLGGTSYVEIFGIGRARDRGLGLIRKVVETIAPDAQGVMLGLQPHAPYSCDPQVYQAAMETGLPLCTHLAETPDELEFTMSGSGPLVEMLRRFGLWDESISAMGAHPVDLVHDALGGAPLLAAHLNCIEDAHVERLAGWPITVAYCPRASAYFGHPRKHQEPHRYRDLLEAGVQVALGTDGAMCLDTPDRISVLDEMRFLYRRDGADPRLLLRMATIGGAQGIGADPSHVTMAPGPVAGIIALEIDADDPREPLTQVMMNSNAPQWVLEPNSD